MMRASPRVSITGPISLSTTAPITVGLSAAISMAIMPPREVPTMPTLCRPRKVKKSSVSSSSTNGV